MNSGNCSMSRMRTSPYYEQDLPAPLRQTQGRQEEVTEVRFTFRRVRTIPGLPAVYEAAVVDEHGYKAKATGTSLEVAREAALVELEHVRQDRMRFN